MTLELQPATPQDEGFLEQVYTRSRASELAGVPWSEVQKQLFLRQQFLARQQHYRTHFPGAAFQLVVAGGIRVGQLCCWEAAQELRLMDLRLLPEWQNRGLGTRLMCGLIRQAAARQQALTLHVERSSPAVRLYRRLGFRVCEQGEVYWRMECRADWSL